MYINYSFLYERETQKKQVNTEYRKTIEKKLIKNIDSLVRKFKSIRKIIVFGSFVNGNFNRFSDIDLYIEDITAQKYYIIKRIKAYSVTFRIS